MESVTSATTTTASTQEDPSPGAAPQISTVPGSRMFKANSYHAKLMHLAQKLSEVAKVTVCMEVNGACSDENLQFGTVIDACGDELIDIGSFLKHSADDIHKAWEEFLKKRLKDRYN